MPVETFAAFVVEQAVAIAIGVVAIALAPKVVQETQKMQSTGETAYGQIAAAPYWYAQQWQALFADARAARCTAVINVAHDDLLAVLAKATAVSDINGRVRLRLPEIHRNETLAADYREALVQMPGITRSQVNPASGRVLIYYELDRYPSLDLLRQALTAA